MDKKTIPIAEITTNDVEDCTQCKYSDMAPDGQAGYCRRYPPIAIHDEEGADFTFPVIDPADWCGEFARRVH